MKYDLEVKVTGADEIAVTLRTMHDDDALKLMKAAAGRGARVIANQAIMNWARINDPGNETSIPANVALRYAPGYQKATGDLKWRVGVLGGAKNYANTRHNRRRMRVGQSYQTGGDKTNPGGDTWYWRLWEYGSKKHPVKAPMRNAAATAGQDAYNTFADAATKALERLVKARAKGR